MQWFSFRVARVMARGSLYFLMQPTNGHKITRGKARAKLRTFEGTVSQFRTDPQYKSEDRL